LLCVCCCLETAADEAVQAPVVNQWAGEDEDDGDGQCPRHAAVRREVVRDCGGVLVAGTMRALADESMISHTVFCGSCCAARTAPAAWDAEPEEPKEKGPALEAPEKKKAVTKRALAKKEEEERRLAERLAQQQKDDPNFGAAERERLRKMELDRDAALAGDLFGAESMAKPGDASSNLPQASSNNSFAAAAAAAEALNPLAAASPAPAAAAAAASGLPTNAALKAGARVEEVALDTDADVTRFVGDLGKRLEKLGKTQMSSKKVLSLLSQLMEESVKIGVLRLDEVGELKRIVTVKHNDMNAKVKKGDKKKATAAAAKPVVALARNAFMVSHSLHAKRSSSASCDSGWTQHLMECCRHVAHTRCFFCSCLYHLRAAWRQFRFACG
jgi:hypothetical protein